MFSGIIQNQGTVVKKRERNGQIQFAFQLKKNERHLKVGESIAVDGVCLTATKVASKYFQVDVIRETLHSTTLGKLRLWEQVNLERSLKLGDRISGHFVTGHVDGCGQIEKIEKQGRNRIFQIKTPMPIIRFLAIKGSVTMNGISLTVQDVKSKSFNVALIPHTLQITTMGEKKIGEWVNLEVDLITRYLKMIQRNLKPSSLGSITLKRLKKEGF